MFLVYYCLYTKLVYTFTIRNYEKFKTIDYNIIYNRKWSLDLMKRHQSLFKPGV
jgi:hypothetical protein